MNDPHDTSRRRLIAGIGTAAALAANPSAIDPNQSGVGSIVGNGALSVIDFMSSAQVTDARLRRGMVDCTDAFNKAFDHARRIGATVHMPDGVYLVGNLIFGTQNQAGQSEAPFGLIGQSKTGTILKARRDLNGTMLKSTSLAGVTFRDFSIDTSESGAIAWDCSWTAGVGPSTQCVIEHILITVHDRFADGTTAHVNWDNLNDSYPLGVTVRPGAGTKYANCYISMVQSGGLSAMTGCIWAGGFLRLGCQNGELSHCWGLGVEFAFGCLNHVRISSGYMYANPSRKTVFWSQRYTPNTGVKSLIIDASELNTQASPGILSYFDLNLFGALLINGSEFIGTAPALFGAKARGDGVGPALCRITGGTYYTQMSINDCPNGSRIEVECEAFRNAQTSEMATKNRGGSFAPVVGNGTTAGSYRLGSGNYGRYHRSGNIVYFRLHIEWSAHTAAGAGVGALVTGLPLQHDPQGVEGVTLEYADPRFNGARALIGGGSIRFCTADGSPVPLGATGSVTLSGFYSIKA